jgi:hypothetical protein
VAHRLAIAFAWLASVLALAACGGDTEHDAVDHSAAGAAAAGRRTIAEPQGGSGDSRAAGGSAATLAVGGNGNSPATGGNAGRSSATGGTVAGPGGEGGATGGTAGQTAHTGGTVAGPDGEGGAIGGSAGAQHSSGGNAAGSGEGGAPSASLVDCGGESPVGMPVAACEDVSDEALLQVAYCDYGIKPYVPGGYYYDSTVPRAIWSETCASDVQEAESQAADWAAQSAASPTGDPTTYELAITDRLTTDRYYEIALVFDGVPCRYRTTRCDYFDGTTLAGAPHSSADELAFLASLLWFQERAGGAHIMGGVSSELESGYRFDLCHTSFYAGDWSQWDEVTLLRTSYFITLDGTVTIGSPESIRTINGEYHVDLDSG